MSNGNVVTAQPMPTASPIENINLEKPSEPIDEKVVLTQPMLNNENINEMLARAEEEGAEKERRRQRNDYCCFVCADSYDTDDTFCWYFFCRMLCNGCGNCCEGCYNCTDSCYDGCADCCHNCCEGQEGCCGSGVGGGDSGDTGDGCDGCCDSSGGSGGDGCDGCCDGDCDCNCDCFS